MPIRTLDEFECFQEALAAAAAISALLKRPAVVQDRKLWSQLGAASSSIPAQIAEGYAQTTDRHFAHYLSIGRGGCNEMSAHLAVALGRSYLSAKEYGELAARYDRLGRRLTRLIQYLRREDRRERGRS
jgi:four helix bundle protein